MAKMPTVLQMNIIELWANGDSTATIAEKLNCSESTIKKAKADPDLKQQYYSVCNEKIEKLVPLAIQRLDRLITDDSQQGAVHIAAVREILDRSHLKELTEKLNTQIDITVRYE